MGAEINVPEVVELSKSIQSQPEKSIETIRLDIRQTVGEYLTGLTSAELTGFLGRGRYEHGQEDANHRNGFCGRSSALKGIGEIRVKVPRDRKEAFETQVIL